MPRTTQVAPPRDRVAARLLLALIVLLPVSTTWVVLTVPDAQKDLNRQTSFTFFDLAMVAIVVVVVQRWWRAGRPFRWTPIAGVGAAFAVFVLVAFAFHPSSHGAEVIVRMLGAVAVVTLVRRLRGADRRLVLGAIFALGVFEAALALGQVWNGSIFGVPAIEMERYKLFLFRGTPAGQGSFSHPYHLVCCLGVALTAGWLGLRDAPPHRRTLWVAGFPIIGTALGMSYSRSGALAVAVVAAIGMLARGGQEGRSPRVASGLLVAAFLFGGYLGLDGWRFKEAVTTDSSSFDNGRGKLASAALDVIGEHPLVGVGPGRYVQVAIDQHASYKLPPHDWLLQIGAEDGILAAAALALLSIVVGWKAVRAGPESTMGFVVLAPFWIADAFPYAYPHGIALSALWLGVILLAIDTAEPHPWRRRAGSERGQEALLASGRVLAVDGAQG